MNDSDRLPSNESIDRFCREWPHETVRPLPDSPEKQKAERLIDELADLVHVARERVPRP